MNRMDEIIRILDENLIYYRHEELCDEINIYVCNKESSGICPYCGTKSEKTHSTYNKKYLSLNIGKVKVRVILINRKLFCFNERCNHLTFAQNVDKKHDFIIRTEKFAEEFKKLCRNNILLQDCCSYRT